MGSYARLSTFYFLYFLAGGFYFPFVSLFYRNLGFTGGQIGVLAGLGPLAGIIMGPIWGYLADQRGWRAPLLRLALLGSVLFAPLLLVPHAFPLVAVLVAALAFFLSPTIPLADATTLEWVKGAGGGTTYGHIRLWGSAGFIGGGLAGGQLFAHISIHYLFAFYAILLLGPLIASLRIGQGTARREGQQRRGNVLALLRRPALGPFYLFAFLAYSTSASYNGFFSLYMQGLGAGSQVIGAAIAVGSISELPVMWYSGRLIARFGPRAVVIGSLFLYAARWFLFALIHNPALAVLVQCLHGPTFAAFYVAGITFVERHVPVESRATGQSLFSAATFGLGTITGSLTYGYLLDHGGASHMYVVAGVVCTGTTLLLALLVRE